MLSNIKDIYSVLILLLEQGANPYLLTKGNESALSVAAYGGTDLLRLLKQHTSRLVVFSDTIRPVDSVLHSEMKKFTHDPAMPLPAYLVMALTSQNCNIQNR